MGPRRGDPTEALHGMARKAVNENRTTVTYADRPDCAAGHVNEPGAEFCRVCGGELLTEAQRRRREDDLLGIPGQDQEMAAERRRAEGTE